MPKLYYSLTSCGAASFMAAYCTGLNLDCEQVDLDLHRTFTGQDFYQVNPKGNVPCLILDDGTILNENVSVLGWIADQVALVNPNKIAPLNGTQDRYLVQNCLSFIATELHPTIGELFSQNSDEISSWIRETVSTKLKYCETCLLTPGREFLVGNYMTIADFYLYVVLSWGPSLTVDMAPYPRTQAFYTRMFNTQHVIESYSRMNQNPSCILGTIQERVQPTLDKISTSLSNVHGSIQPAVERFSEKLKPAVQKMETSIQNLADTTNQKIDELKDKYSSTPTMVNASSSTPVVEDNRPLNERIESKLASAQASMEPTLINVSEQLKPTVEKVESSIHNLADSTNVKIDELKDKYSGPSSTQPGPIKEKVDTPINNPNAVSQQKIEELKELGKFSDSETSSSDTSEHSKMDALREKFSGHHVTTTSSTSPPAASNLNHLNHVSPTASHGPDGSHNHISDLKFKFEHPKPYVKPAAKTKNYKIAELMEKFEHQDPSKVAAPPISHHKVAEKVGMFSGHPTTSTASNTAPNAPNHSYVPIISHDENSRPPLGERIENKLPSAQASAQPMSENIAPTVPKVESTVKSSSDTTNSEIAKLREKFEGHSKSTEQQPKPFVEDAENQKPPVNSM